MPDFATVSKHRHLNAVLHQQAFLGRLEGLLANPVNANVIFTSGTCSAALLSVNKVHSNFTFAAPNNSIVLEALAANNSTIADSQNSQPWQWRQMCIFTRLLLQT